MTGNKLRRWSCELTNPEKDERKLNPAMKVIFTFILYNKVDYVSICIDKHVCFWPAEAGEYALVIFVVSMIHIFTDK